MQNIAPDHPSPTIHEACSQLMAAAQRLHRAVAAHNEDEATAGVQLDALSMAVYRCVLARRLAHPALRLDDVHRSLERAQDCITDDWNREMAAEVARCSAN